MKFKKFFTALALSGFLMAGALFVGKGAAEGAKVAKANDVVEIGIDEIFITKDTKAADNFYLTPDNDDYDLPISWDYVYTASAEAEAEGVFINGVKQNSAFIKYAPVGEGEDAYPYVYCHFPAVSDGDKVQLSGTFATTSDGGHSFSIHYTVQRFADTWVNELEDYGVVSLKDANTPDFSYVSINTEDTSGYGYIGSNDKDGAKKLMPKRNGIFGYTNDTQSFGFQFKLEVSGTMSKWLDIRIGASGGWETGHFLSFHIWNHDNDGVVIAKECVGSTVHHREEFRSNITDGERVVEMGSIRVKDYENKYENKYYVFFKNNGSVSFGEYWDFQDGYRSTKIGIYHDDADIKISNSIEPAVTTTLSLSSISTGTALYFNTTTNVLPFLHTWDYYFRPQDSDGFEYNGTDIDAVSAHYNYFKKVGSSTANAFYFGFGDLGITPAEGDVFHLGGMFKLAKFESDAEITVVYKIVIKDCYFQFDGTKWMAINPNYSVEDFCYDVLRETCGICAAKDDGNHDALVTVWTLLANDSHYGALTLDQQSILASASADPTIEVPTTVAEIDDLLPEEAVGAAMYRYDVLTGKYALANFIVGRTPVANSSGASLNFASENNNTMVIVISIAAISALAFSMLLVFKKKKQK